jgi:hypothetical protein
MLQRFHDFAPVGVGQSIRHRAVDRLTFIWGTRIAFGVLHSTLPAVCIESAELMILNAVGDRWWICPTYGIGRFKRRSAAILG